MRKIEIKMPNDAPCYNSLYTEFFKDKSLLYTKATTDGYKWAVLPFCNWLCENRFLLTQNHVNEYIYILNQHYENKVTLYSALRRVRTFCNWCYDNEYIVKKISIKVKKEYELVKEVYTLDELKKLLVRPENGTFNDFRNWAMVNFLIGTGCRLNTLINIKIQDVNFNNDTILFTTTKNKKLQVIPLSLSLKKVLNYYLKLWEQTPSDYLFPDMYGNKMENSYVTHTVNKYNRNRGVSKTSVHLFRHTFAHNYLLNGGDIFRLQNLLGHSSLDMVKIYANMNNIESLKQNYSTLNVLDKVNMNKQAIQFTSKRK